MNELLRQVESISACRDRDLLAVSLVSTLKTVFGPSFVRLCRLSPNASPESQVVIIAEASCTGVELCEGIGKDERTEPLADNPLIAAAVRDAKPVWKSADAHSHCVFPLPDAGNTTICALAVMGLPALVQSEREALEQFVKIYVNFIGLLDYSERDTLTGLLNRKTFDEAFDRMLASIPAEVARGPDDERREGRPVEEPRWIGVIDIDHFKRVNDTYGHLFGDEVLLRVANVMKTVFRRSDRLFRFGGEEFVVMLQPTPDAHVLKVFDRFRQMLEKHEFPQIGQITCSLGFTRVDPAAAPTDILGRADQALYFAKEHGRNQTLNFEELVEQGLIVVQQAEAAQTDADLDALFD
jgi:diguanylate cyclase (GGDEF)-like protein